MKLVNLKTGAGLLKMFCLFWLLCASAGRGMAQEKAVSDRTSRWSAELKFGAAVPTGSFASTDPSKADAGWAETGPALGLALNYRITRYFAVNLSLSGQENQRNNAPLISSIKASQPSATSSEVHADVGTWTIGRILAGGYFMIPLSSSGKWNLRPGISAGVLKTGIPRSNYAAVFQGPLNPLGPGGTGTISESGAYKVPSFPWSFCYAVDVGLEYAFDPKFYVTGETGYFYSAPRSIYTANPASSGGVTGTVIIPPPGGGISIADPSALPKRSFPVTSLTVMVGIGMRF
jgi:hypothetical protein